jgi:hypothetical protein
MSDRLAVANHESAFDSALIFLGRAPRRAIGVRFAVSRRGLVPTDVSAVGTCQAL